MADMVGWGEVKYLTVQIIMMMFQRLSLFTFQYQKRKNNVDII